MKRPHWITLFSDDWEDRLWLYEADNEKPTPLTLMSVIASICKDDDEYIHHGIACGICKGVIAGVRYRCSICTSFDVCPSCRFNLTSSNSDHIPGHLLYEIAYRRLDLPTTNGKNHAILERFASGTTSDSFYLHYPWLFSAALVEELITGTSDEDKSRRLLVTPARDSDQIQAQIALDARVRRKARVDWRWSAVQELVRPMLDREYLRTYYSKLFHDIYLALTKHSCHQVVSLGSSAERTSHKSRLLHLNLDDDDVIACQDAMHHFVNASDQLLRDNELPKDSLLTQVDPSSLKYIPPAGDQVSASAKYIELLSMNYNLHSLPLPTFEEEDVLLRPRMSSYSGSSWSISESMKRWQEYSRKYEELLSRLDNHFQGPHPVRDNVDHSPLVEVVTQPPLADDILHNFVKLAVSKDFRQASSLVHKLNPLEPLHLFKIMAFHERRGAVSDAYKVAKTIGNCVSATEGLWFALSRVAAAYFACYTEGGWVAALNAATASLDLFSFQCTTNHREKQYVQVYCFKIVLLITRDRNRKLPEALSLNLGDQLQCLRRSFVDVGEWDLALDVLDLEMRSRQTPLTVFDIGHGEYNYYSIAFVPSLEHVMETFWNFAADLKKTHVCDDSVASYLGEIEDSARILAAQALMEHRYDENGRERLEDVRSLWPPTKSPVAKAERAMLDIWQGIERSYTENPSWKDIEKCFRDHEYFKGLLVLYQLDASWYKNERASRARGQTLPPSVPTNRERYESLSNMALEAGNKLLANIYQVRYPKSWSSLLAIGVCEALFHPSEGFLSDQLFFEASKSLSQLYGHNDNCGESATFARLHLRIAHARQDPQTLGDASMLYFRSVCEMIPEIPNQHRLHEAKSLGLSFVRMVNTMCRTTLQYLQNPEGGISASSLRIESLLLCAQLARHIIDDFMVQEMSDVIILAIYLPLQLAVNLLYSMPPEILDFLYPGVCLAVGISAEMITNPTLALLCYNLGQMRLPESEGRVIATLQLRIARCLVALVQINRSDFSTLEDLAFWYLLTAGRFFGKNGSRSYKYAREADLLLSKAYVSRIGHQFDELELSQDLKNNMKLSHEQRRNKERVLDCIEEGRWFADSAFRRIRLLGSGLEALPPMQAHEYCRLVYSRNVEELHWNRMWMEFQRAHFMGGAVEVLQASQDWKASSLCQLAFWDIHRDEDILESIQQGVSMDALCGVAAETLKQGQNMIFVDWARCHDQLFMSIWNLTSGELDCSVVAIGYSQIEEWVREKLGVTSSQQGRIERRRLSRFEDLKELAPILQPLKGMTKPNDLLLFCPTGILHEVPLQAIPFSPRGEPLIASNSVVFCPNIVMLQCYVLKAWEARATKSVPVAAFTRLGGDDALEEERIQDTARRSLSDESLRLTLHSGREVTRKVFEASSQGVRLLHYHGHVYLDASERRGRALQLEPTFTAEQDHGDNGMLRVMDVFELNLDAALVVLLACASGEDDIAPNDDPLGIASAFLCAGATTVVVTRWPTQTVDARDFASRFYRHAFGSRDDYGMVNVAEALRAAVVEMCEDWDSDNPYHWAQFQLYGSWCAKV